MTAELHPWCEVCGRTEKFNFHVPDEIWRMVMPKRYWNSVVCLGCFDYFAGLRKVNYARHLINLCFAGDYAVFNFTVDEALSPRDYHVDRFKKWEV